MRIIIIGAGVVGYTIAKKLSDEGQDIVLIEKDEKIIEDVRDSLDVRIIHGSGSSPQVLKEAGIDKVDMVIAVTDSDEVNMVACLIAGTQSKVPKKVARIREREYVNYPMLFDKEHLDLDLNINPEKVAADRILKTVDLPGAVEVEEFASGRLKLVGAKLSPQSPLIDKTSEEIREIYPNEKVLIVAVYRGAETIIPRGDTRFQTGDLVFAVTVPESAGRLMHLFGAEDTTGGKVLIVGGGDIGFYLAEHLEKSGYKPKIIERNPERCAFLAENLNKTIVLSGDGTDRELLTEESISETDIFIAVTDDEEANILSSLLAKRLGAKRCITLIDKPEYLSMVSTIGIDVAVSPRLSSVSGILQFIRRGKILSVTTLMEERVEAIETIAMETSDMVDKPIRDVKFPSGALIGAIVRGDEVILPDGYSVINPGDAVVIFALRDKIAKVEKALMVKPEFF
ncbi:MAG: Trk system potassium transporter TrkA [Proteobacteria bacterium]|nr:Trk system potassium transporter TrkA [Pseudomonadota bacterium]